MKRALVLGGGPSLANVNRKQIEDLRERGVTVYGTNVSFLYYPVDWVVIQDKRCLQRYWPDLKCRGVRVYYPRPGDLIIATGVRDPEWESIITPVSRSDTWPTSPEDGFVQVNNAGLLALQLADSHGYDEIGLLGIDLQYGPNRKSNFHDQYPPTWTRGNCNYSVMAKSFERWCPQIRARVFNMTKESTLTCFEKKSLICWL